jgi:hypothetical protein
VSRLIERPELGGAALMLYNAPPSYLKFYLVCFSDQAVPAGFQGTYRMVTGFFDAGPDAWERQADALADALRTAPK